MNKSMIRFVLGWVLLLEGCFMLLPCLVALYYREDAGWSYLVVGGCAVLLGFLIRRKKPDDTTIFMREGFLVTGLSWILLSLVGCLPFVITGDIPNFADALFETISGFTTTGSSILPEVEALAYTNLFWRSMTHWLGGMGVLVFLLMVVKLAGGSNLNLMKAESPGPVVGKLVPKLRHSAGILYQMYLLLTVIMIILLLCGHMSVFDALTTAFGTAGTGGFGIKNDSIASYSPYIQWVVTVFMLLFGVNFNLYYLILLRKWKDAWNMEEVKCYFGVVIVAIAAIMVNVYNTAISFEENLRNVSFSVASVITTTGFATVDFDKWPELSRMILVMLMFCGACAGSTGGGIKVSRFILMIKGVSKELLSYIYPKSVRTVKMDGKPVDREVIRSTNVYFVIYMMVFVISVFCICWENKDMVTNLTAVAATLNNIGPGLNQVGPTCNFSSFSIFSKCILMFDMLAGRLELFPMLMLLYPHSWKGILKRQAKNE